MKVFGKMDFNLNEVYKFVVEPYDGSADPNKPFPDYAKQGLLLFRTDEQMLYICVSENPAVWIPLIKLNASYVHNQDTVASEWDIIHNLETQNVMVQVFDVSGNKFVPEDIQVVDNNTIKVIVNPPSAGKALVIALDAQVGLFVQHNQLSLDILKSRQEITQVDYDENDNPVKVYYGDGTTCEITYRTTDPAAGEIDTITFYSSGGTILEQWQYIYDEQGRISQLRRLA